MAQAQTDEFAGIAKAGEFARIPKAKAAAAPDQGGDVLLDNIKNVIKFGADTAGGFARGIESHAQRVAAPVRKKLGMKPADPTPEETTTGGKIGRGVESVAEFAGASKVAKEVGALLKVAPKLRAAGFRELIAKYGKTAVDAALQYAGGYGTAKVQGDPRPKTAGAISAAVPAVGQVAQDAVPALKRGAQAGVAKVLALGQSAKKLDAKEMPKLLSQGASDALQIGLQKTWKAWKSVTAAVRERGGQALEEAYAGPEGSEILPTASVRQSLDTLVDKMSTRVEWLDEDNAPLTGEARKKAMEAWREGGHVSSGVSAVTQREMNHPLVRAVYHLKRELPDHMYARDLGTLKRQWDAAVFGKNEAGEPLVYLNDRLIAVKKLAAKTAADGIRDLFKNSPETATIANINNYVSRAIKLNQLVTNAARAATGGSATSVFSRRVGMASGKALIGGVFGEEVGRRQYSGELGGTAGGVLGFVLGAAGVRALDAAFRSAAWKLLPAASKDALATAIVDGKVDQVMRIVQPLLAKGAAGSPAAPQATTTPPTATATATPPP